MTKIVYSTCYGGFGLSEKASRMYLEQKGHNFTEEADKYGHTNFLVDGEYFDCYDIERTDPILVEVVEKLGKSASGNYANLVICDLPPGTKYRIEEYDGFESVETADDIDWSTA